VGSLVDQASQNAAIRSTGRALLASVTLAFFGWTLARSSVWSDELRLYTHISATARTEAWAHYNLGLAHQARGRTESAEKAYLRTLEIDPSLARAHYNLGHIDLKREEPAAAVRHFQRAVEVQADFSNAWNNLGVALTRTGRVQEALEAHRKAVVSDPSNAAAHANLGLLYLRMGRRDLAVDERNTLQKLDRAMAAELNRALKQQ
jgi:tetratricopeptide (TPR) repeat protein